MRFFITKTRAWAQTAQWKKNMLPQMYVALTDFASWTGRTAT